MARRRNPLSDGPWAALFFAVMLCVAVIGGGCESSSAPPPPRATKAMTDPSAERLHELSGAVLLHYIRHNQLPASLEALHELDASIGDPIDPLYGDPYVYLSPPVDLPGRRGQLLMYAPGVARGHRASRWAVLVEGVGQDASLTTQVVLIPSAEIAKAVQ